MTPEEIEKKFNETFRTTKWNISWPDAPQEVLDAGFYRAGFDGPLIKMFPDEPDMPFIVG